MPSDLERLALHLDPERAEALARALQGKPGADLGLVLGAAYPALEPQRPALLDAIGSLSRDGLTSRRVRLDILGRLNEAVAHQPPGNAWQGALQRAVWLEKVRIALREVLPPKLGGAELSETARELAELADAVVEVALAEATGHVAGRFGHPVTRDAGVPAQLCVLGMGKLGGLELNAGSDIDIVFVYDSDDAQGEATAHDFFTRVVRRLVSHIESTAPEGMIFRVDLRLRPEGSQGAIVNSLSAFERYYETWGRLWERAAMLRARPVAGSPELGAAIEREVILPFVYRREVDPNVAHGLTDMVLRSRAELSDHPARDLKLGPGGIREAEFFVQTLQLIWGGKEPSLRVRGTLTALERLRLRGFVSDREARDIARSYVLLRRAEHAIQWGTGIQTHLLPIDERDSQRLARVLGYPDAATFMTELGSLRQRVSEAFASLSPGARERPRYARMALLIGETSEGSSPADDLSRAAHALFQGSEVPDHVRALSRRPDGLLGTVTQQQYPDLADRVLEGLLECPDPDQAARYLRSVFARLSAPGAYVAALAEDPRALSRLLTVLGSSGFVGEAIVTRPELLDIVLFGQGSVSDVHAAVSHQLEDLERLLEGLDRHERDEALVGALRQVKSRVLVEVAIADLAGAIGTRQATRTLSALADEIMSAVVHHLLGHARGLCIIAVGKLGGREIGYASDLDLLFLYDPEAAPNPDEAAAYFSRYAQRIIRMLAEPHAGGPGYVMDTRLRPSGSHGLLVASVRSFASYHGLRETEAGAQRPAGLSAGAAWERQALIRARFCAGDVALGQRVMALATLAAYEGGPISPEEMQRLRLRMERELGRERPTRRELKVGRGGLLDIEFLAQWLQMQHGQDERVRTPDTSDALEALSALGHLARADYELLRDAYRFLRRLEQRIHVHRGDGMSWVDAQALGLSGLGRKMGFQSSPSKSAGEQLFERYLTVTETVRATYLRLLALPSDD
ncbi:MAG TPA: bifunctional [glutamate--ammonia ligase]-adenylyl-L-tyrosine phosphorylase/[glutamate--ammonia-ligase] adenylyltransferase [Polyangiaceae bacterium]|nr:bifunctional [glutamate--ammonia ligase]-adenylyl-L-tyrosine phosphorylase/[glutamate--ammonia-ligase] adenylyltransferase [Polyangiaceae bacterium]